MTSERKYQLYDDQFRRQAHQIYARMRAEDPVLQQPGLDDETPIWFVTRYAEVEQVLLDDKAFVRDPGLVSAELAEKYAFPDQQVEAMMFDHMLNRDGAAHARLEAEVALRALLERFPDLRLDIAESDLAWRDVPLFRSLVQLPVRWQAET